MARCGKSAMIIRHKRNIAKSNEFRLGREHEVRTGRRQFSRQGSIHVVSTRCFHTFLFRYKIFSQIVVTYY